MATNFAATRDDRAAIGAEIGSGCMVYANLRCPRCAAPHAQTSWLREDWKTRFKLMRIAAEILAARKTSQIPVWTGKKFKTKADKLRALRSSRNGMTLNSDQRLVLMLLDGEEGGMTAEELCFALVAPPTDAKQRKDAIARFESTVLSTMFNGGNLKKIAGRYALAAIGSDGPAIRLVPDFTVSASGTVKGGVAYGVEGQGRVGEINVNLNGQFMLGLLVTAEKTFIAASGTGLAHGGFKEVAKNSGFVVCGPRTASHGTHKSITGLAISADLYQATKDPSATDPGNCAAPRMLETAFEDAGVNKTLHGQWRMSEIWFLPKTDTRTREQENGLYWTHGASAESCKTCENLAPLLMCPRTS